MDKLLFTLVYVTLMVLYSGCSKPVMAPEFSSYSTKFTTEAGVRGHTLDISNISIQFGDAGGHAATCFPDDARIEISASAWSTLIDTQKELLIFHELGHCVLFRLHNMHKDIYGYPVSIMFPTTVPPNIYLLSRSRFIDELFHP